MKHSCSWSSLPEKRCPCGDVEEIVKRSILASMGKRLPKRKWPFKSLMCFSAGHKLTGASLPVHSPNLLLQTTELRSSGVEPSGSQGMVPKSALITDMP